MSDWQMVGIGLAGGIFFGFCLGVIFVALMDMKRERNSMRIGMYVPRPRTTGDFD